MAEGNDTYDDVIRKLDEYFKPIKNTALAVYLFRELKQKQGETVEQFITRLKSEAINCGFENPTAEIKAQIFQKTSNKKFKRDILKHPNWTLDDVVSEARSLETSELQAGKIEEKDNPFVNHSTVNKITATRGRGKQQPMQQPMHESKCKKCGGKPYHPPTQCPAKKW
ncbi:uncharacterized protein LOC117109094 [Anneissia japonica]|uniref:uncharacterized protein LOC117109094 n=1 Tax=Anneissia japonica TaxID=1529436 RepID=UPI0014254DAF|nr:uncharacterized protein LOC117109094 [Anneissia japonica]